MMEEYETKRQYLRHLKKMGEIREGVGKLPVFPTSPSNIILSRTSNRSSTQKPVNSSALQPEEASFTHWEIASTTAQSE
jgi:hypothetical protein